MPLSLSIICEKSGNKTRDSETYEGPLLLSLFYKCRSGSYSRYEIGKKTIARARRISLLYHVIIRMAVDVSSCQGRPPTASKESNHRDNTSECAAADDVVGTF